MPVDWHIAGPVSGMCMCMCLHYLCVRWLCVCVYVLCRPCHLHILGNFYSNIRACTRFEYARGFSSTCTNMCIFTAHQPCDFIMCSCARVVYLFACVRVFGGLCQYCATCDCNTRANCQYWYGGIMSVHSEPSLWFFFIGTCASAEEVPNSCRIGRYTHDESTHVHDIECDLICSVLC